MLSDLRLRDFRCFERLEAEFAPTRTFIVGNNAQGKSSLLEAVCLLLRLQSPRTTTVADAVRLGTEGFGIDGHAGGRHLTFHFGSAGRSLVLDSKPLSRTEDYLDVARVAWFANTDLELVRGSGSVRRRFMDFLGSQCVPGYRKSLRAYEKSLRSRNALLKDNRPRREIEAFDPVLLEHGEILVSSRGELCAALAPLCATACNEISGQNDHLEIAYRPSHVAPLAAALEASRAEETRLRQTLVGPHRDDLEIRLNELGASGFASEGQQRGIALALKLAQARHLEAIQNRSPILLLDDIFGELDTQRRNRLLASLPKNSQVLITTTFLDWADLGPDASVLQLENGELTANG